ncbi:MAG TPA: hypothetical protein VMU45_13320 [Candidatus Eisenbacteria bacterium]|nr:hypothetical protein [Candidatus Eisenbacteria bacterium]
MVTRIVFLLIALAIVGAVAWAYHHDVELGKRVAEVEIGDPNEAVRELLGEPSSQGPCGSLGVAPAACTDEYVYKYYYSIFQPKYEVVWFNAEGKVIGEQRVQRLY